MPSEDQVNSIPEKAFSESQPPLIEKPKIVLIDLEHTIIEALRKQGYNVTAGTFGTPFRVEKSDAVAPAFSKSNIPGLFEQEIAIIDLSMPKAPFGPTGEKPTSEGELDFWASCSRGIIDPRPRYMSGHRKDFDRIYEHGGCLVIFAESAVPQRFILGRKPYGYVFQEKNETFISWTSLLSTLAHISTTGVNGRELATKRELGDFTKVAEYFSKNSSFHTDLADNEWIRQQGQDSWTCLCENKFGTCVAAAIKGNGLILLLPHPANKTEATQKLIEEFLPELSPQLFPENKAKSWTRTKKYELEPVTKLQMQKEQLEAELKNKIGSIDTEILSMRHQWKHLYSLLTEASDSLVDAVRSSLEMVGFSGINADELAPNNFLQEDLQIIDTSPALILEIKGLAGLPNDASTNQVWKYIARRMKEWNRTDVRGVVIINHQRNIPPSERQNASVFTTQQEEDAIHHDITLFSSWEIFQLLRGMLRWYWPQEAIRPKFFKPGRISLVPEHYIEIGKIVKEWPHAHAFSAELNQGLSLGERIGFIRDNEYWEQDVTSLEIATEPVVRAEAGQRVGIGTSLSIPIGQPLYRVIVLSPTTGAGSPTGR
jgi:hypothetical protein